MLLDGRRGAFALQALDICGHMHGLDAPEFTSPLPFAPAQEGSGRPRVFVADVDGEEFEEAACGPFPSPSDQRWENWPGRSEDNGRRFVYHVFNQ
jgi:hypothetical protein